MLLDAVVAWRREHRRNAPKVRLNGVLFPPGKWLNDMRRAYKAGTIRPCVLDALRRIGYDFDA
ncbi:MAG: hypothetical protein ACYCS8_06020, partial [Acidithiobacillus sp.]